ncbi:hypothetical protein GTY86_23460 [Streptomyces sp. SID5770]|uniref:hypothetical protein n=1 Tax=Streptomyces sp. SID5770 TaxID=2690308 RepID=UPI0013722E4E|nr:hypothetical protein [Streptomyces sp. SID5770]MZE54173.1 hypothetical protein [Streptomyces sp. SID5770]
MNFFNFSPDIDKVNESTSHPDWPGLAHAMAWTLMTGYVRATLEHPDDPEAVDRAMLRIESVCETPHALWAMHRQHPLLFAPTINYLREILCDEVRWLGHSAMRVVGPMPEAMFYKALAMMLARAAFGLSEAHAMAVEGGLRRAVAHCRRDRK